MAQSTSQVGNLNITTQILPAANTIDSAVPSSAKNLVPVINKHFKKIPVKALSSVLMLAGIIQLCFGFVMYSAEIKQPSLTVRSGVSLWAGLVVFMAGCVSLTALLKDTVDLIKVCMACNIVNVTVATIGMILYAIQIYNETQTCWARINEHGNSCLSDNVDSYSFYNDKEYIMTLRIAINAVIIAYSLLGLLISCFMAKVSDKALKASGYSLMG